MALAIDDGPFKDFQSKSSATVRGDGETEQALKIYTKTGDAGETGLLAEERVSKGDPRIEVIGAVDELNAFLGLSAGQAVKIKQAIERIQGELFMLGAELAGVRNIARAVKVLGGEHIALLESEIDQMEARLTPLRNFILPGGSPAGASLHIARSVCRRAERRFIGMSQYGVRAELGTYLNRLSDWLFVAARFSNMLEEQPETSWVPQ